jgi:hypothetical protein
MWSTYYDDVSALTYFRVLSNTHVYKTVASSLWSDQAATPCETLASKDTLPLVPLGAVAAEHPADLTWGDTNVTSWDISICTNMLIELTHERNAEFANLIVALALGIEISTTLAATHLNCTDVNFCAILQIERWLLTASESILEDLFEAQEFENRKIDSRVESEAALVGTKCGVELDTISTVYLDLSLIILPCDTELDNALWD